MKSIAFIVPWGGGKLPTYFQLWLESCRRNPSVDFLVFTDDYTEYSYPDNVKVHYMSFEQMKELFQNHYDFPLSISAPYKFCDFRPAFGEIFSDYLVGYDYWGHCDVDLIWGDIRKFVTDDVLTKYKRIFSRGHCSIYENSSKVNAFYRTLPACGCQDWKNVFQSEKSCCFDEWAGHCGGGMSQIMLQNNVTIFDEVCSADINVNKGNFEINRMEKHRDLYFAYENGRMKLKGPDMNREVLCAHFQKRAIEIEKDINYDKYYFVAPCHITSDESKIKSHVIENRLFEIRRLLKRVQSKMR